jgi:hypothetical protein
MMLFWRCGARAPCLVKLQSLSRGQRRRRPRKASHALRAHFFVTETSQDFAF